MILQSLDFHLVSLGFISFLFYLFLFISLALFQSIGTFFLRFPFSFLYFLSSILLSLSSYIFFLCSDCPLFLVLFFHILNSLLTLPYLSLCFIISLFHQVPPIVVFIPFSCLSFFLILIKSFDTVSLFLSVLHCSLRVPTWLSISVHRKGLHSRF